MALLESLHRSARPLRVPEEKATVFRMAIEVLDDTGIPFAVDGGLALYAYTGIRREVHDLDFRLRPEDLEPAMRALRGVGFTTEVKHQQWLVQALRDDVQVDLVFGIGTWHAWVDRTWVDRGREYQMLGHQVNLTPPEEMFWAKAFRCSRWAYDGNDLFHLLEAMGDQMDWPHLVSLFGEDWEVLLSHLILFRYVFPSRAHVIPNEILNDLLGRLDRSRRSPWNGDTLCRGPIIDGADTYDQYILERGYIDGRKQRWEDRPSWEKDLAPGEAG